MQLPWIGLFLWFPAALGSGAHAQDVRLTFTIHGYVHDAAASIRSERQIVSGAAKAPFAVGLEGVYENDARSLEMFLRHRLGFMGKVPAAGLFGLERPRPHALGVLLRTRTEVAHALASGPLPPGADALGALTAQTRLNSVLRAAWKQVARAGGLDVIDIVDSLVRKSDTVPRSSPQRELSDSEKLRLRERLKEVDLLLRPWFEAALGAETANDPTPPDIRDAFNSDWGDGLKWNALDEAVSRWREATFNEATMRFRERSPDRTEVHLFVGASHMLNVKAALRAQVGRALVRTAPVFSEELKPSLRE